MEQCVKSGLIDKEASIISSGVAEASVQEKLKDIDMEMKDYGRGKEAHEVKKLVEKEEQQTGSVSLMVYWIYLQAAGGVLFVGLVLVSYRELNIRNV